MRRALDSQADSPAASGSAPEGTHPAGNAAPPRGAGERDPRDPYLTQLGERIRTLRAARGMSRKDLARGADVSERYLANLETGTGNASVLLLRQVAAALDVP